MGLLFGEGGFISDLFTGRRTLGEVLTGRNKYEKEVYANPELTEEVTAKIRQIATTGVKDAEQNVFEALRKLNYTAQNCGAIEISKFEPVFDSISSTISSLADSMDQKVADIKEYEEAGVVEKVFSSITMTVCKAGEGLLSVVEDIGDGVLSVVGWTAGLFGEGGKKVRDWIGDKLIKPNWSHDVFNFYYKSDFAKASAFTEDSLVSGACKLAGKVVGYYFLGAAAGAAIGGVAAKGVGVASKVATVATHVASTSTLGMTAVSAVGGLGSGTSSALQAGYEYNDAMKVGLKQGAIQGALAFVGGKLGEHAQAVQGGAKGIKAWSGKATDASGATVQGYNNAITKAGEKFGKALTHQEGMTLASYGNDILTGVKAAPGKVVNGIKNVPGKISDSIRNTATKLKPSNVAKGIKNAGSTAVNGVKNAILHPIKTTGSIVSKAATTTASIVTKTAVPAVAIVSESIKDDAKKSQEILKRYNEEEQLINDVSEKMVDRVKEAVGNVPVANKIDYESMSSHTRGLDDYELNTIDQYDFNNNNNIVNENLTSKDVLKTGGNINKETSTETSSSTKNKSSSKKSSSSDGTTPPKKEYEEITDTSIYTPNTDIPEVSTQPITTSTSTFETSTTPITSPETIPPKETTPLVSSGNITTLPEVEISPINSSLGNNTSNTGVVTSTETTEVGTSNSVGAYSSYSSPSQNESTSQTSSTASIGTKMVNNTVDSDIASDIEDTSIQTSLSDAVSDVFDDIIKGNKYSKAPTSVKPVQSKKIQKMSSAIPIAAGLATASVAGLGAKAYMDRKENNDVDDEEFIEDTELEDYRDNSDETTISDNQINVSSPDEGEYYDSSDVVDTMNYNQLEEVN